MKPRHVLYSLVYPFGLSAALAVVSGCALPGGPGDFDRPAMASAMQASFVRYYEQCGEPSLDTGLGVYGCPLSAPSSYSFGPDGSCMVKSSAVRKDACESGGACNDLKLHVDCTDIRDVSGSPATLPGWKLKARYRATMATVNGDMTVIDASVALDLDASDGDLSIGGGGVNDFIRAAYGSAAAAYTGPLNVQIVDAKIVDPDSKIFAVMGFSGSGD